MSQHNNKKKSARPGSKNNNNKQPTAQNTPAAKDAAQNARPDALGATNINAGLNAVINKATAPHAPANNFAHTAPSAIKAATPAPTAAAPAPAAPKPAAPIATKAPVATAAPAKAAPAAPAKAAPAATTATAKAAPAKAATPAAAPTAATASANTVKKAATAQQSASFQDAAEHINDTVDILASNFDTFMKTAETINGQLQSFNQNVISQNTALSKDFFSCKTFQDLAEFQTKIFQINSENFVSNASSLTEAIINCFNQTLAPIEQKAKARR